MDPFSKLTTILLIGVTFLFAGQEYWLVGISNEVLIALAVWLTYGLILLMLLAVASWHVVRVEQQEQIEFERFQEMRLPTPTISIGRPTSASDSSRNKRVSSPRYPAKWNKAA